MAQVGSNNEPLHERAQFVYTGSLWVPMLADANGQPRVVLPDETFVRNFEGIVEEKLSDTALAAGNNTLTGTAVPTGEIHVITLVQFVYVGTGPTRVYIDVNGLATNIVIFNQESPASGQRYPYNCKVYAQAGDQLRANVQGATLNDDLFFAYAGYKFTAP